MKIKLTLLAAAVALAPMSAMAGGSLDLFYIDNDLEFDGTDVNGNGFGLRGNAELGNGFALTGLYQSSENKVQGDKLEVIETRVGLSYTHQLNEQFSIVGTGDMVQLDVKEKNNGLNAIANDGFAVGIGVKVAVVDNLNVYANIGYLDLGKLAGERLDGYEYSVGGSYAFTPHIAGFIEYRKIDTEVANTDIDLDTIRVGGRYTF